MNIFYLSTDPTICASLHCDKHVVKMILEYGQLLSTAHHVLGSGTDEMYKEAYTNHPSAVWVRQSPSNYQWLYSLFVALLAEYKFRYGRDHASSRLFDVLQGSPAASFMLRAGFSEPPQCMPDEYKHPDTVTAYRKYYALGKWQLLKYTKRPVPEWAKGSYIWKD